MLLNHTKTITKQEERKRAAQRLVYFSPAKRRKKDEHTKKLQGHSLQDAV